MRGVFLALLILLSAAPAFGQVPPEEENPIDRLGAVVKDGHLNVEADLRQGSVPAIPNYALEIRGSPRTTIEADAVGGEVTKMHFRVENGKLVVRGKGLRPKVSIESLDFQSPKGVTDLKFQGLGIWRPIVAVFGGIARSAVRKMHFRTDVASVLKGDILGGKKETPGQAPPGPAPTPTPPPPPSFMTLVDEVRIRDVKLTAFEGRPVAFAPFVAFHTASHPASGEAMTLTIERGVFRPGREGASSFIDLAGHLDNRRMNVLAGSERLRSIDANPFE